MERNTEAAIEAMHRFQNATKQLEEQREVARKYLEMVNSKIQEDLMALEEEIVNSRRSLEAFITQENDGKQFKVPGLGSAYLTTRRSLKINREEFIDAIAPVDSPRIYETKYSETKAKELAKEYLDRGQLLNGVEQIETVSMSVRIQ